ncbi:hypothetical protein [Paenarthrobacter nicotinovorans]|uniref:hypothetical protein n=1 Tax=Paenarthrobacter nicotinovorans TaxID=29320 RepID=UPI003DA1E05C
MNDDSWADESEYGLVAPGSRNSRRYGSKDRVVIGGGGLAVGVAVAHLTFCLLLAVQSPGGWALVFFIYSLIPVWAIGVTAGSLLGLVLRRITNQWINVAVFFLAPVARLRAIRRALPERRDLLFNVHSYCSWLRTARNLEARSHQ